MSAIDVTELEPHSHSEAMALQSVELDTTLRFLRTLDDGDWSTMVPDCPDWDVRCMYLHVLGACEGAAPVEMMRQMTSAMRRRHHSGGPLEANLSAVQVAARAAMQPAELLERLAAATPRAVRHRTRLPRWIRSGVSMKVDGPVIERWKLGYLIDTIYLRDLWMHRIDAARAVGRSPELVPAHDGRIVADVVAEWARRHGRPFELTLTGPIGGSFVAGENGTSMSLDAVEFCRTLSGRVPADELLATVVPF